MKLYLFLLGCMGSICCASRCMRCSKKTFCTMNIWFWTPFTLNCLLIWWRITWIERSISSSVILVCTALFMNKIVSVESHSKVEQWLKIFEGIVYESLHIEKNMFAIRVSSPLCCKYKGEDLCAAFVYDLWKNHKLEGVDYTHNKAISQMKEKEIQSIRRFLIVWWLDSDSQWVEWVEGKNWSLQTIKVLYRNKLQKSTRGQWSAECFPRYVPLVVLGVQLSFRCSQIWFVISECNGSLYQ